MSVVVYAPRPLQLSRLIARDKIEKEEAQKRINSQMNIDEKRDLAGWVIDNSSDVEHLKKETQKFIDFVRNDYAHLKV
jgi:dephospho-CoA kinase